MRRSMVCVTKHLDVGGGVPTVLLQTLPRLSEHYRVRVLCYRRAGTGAPQLEAAGIPVDVVRLRGGKWTPTTLLRYRNYFLAQAPDVVHAHSYTANTLAVMTAAWAGVPVRVRHLHATLPWGEFGGIKLWSRRLVDRFIARRAQITLAVSGAVRDQYLEHLGLPPEDCRVVYNGIDLARFEDCAAAGRRVRAELGVADGAPLAGVVGRLTGGKGHEFFLQAARRIVAQLPEARFLVVGEGDTRCALERQAGELGIRDRVLFVGHRDDVPALLGAMDVFLMPSLTEGHPMVVLEAQAARVPVVGFDIPALAEVIEHDVTGSLVPVGDAASLAREAAAYLGDPVCARRVAEAARRQVRETMSLEIWVESVLAVYDDLLDGELRRG